MSIDVLLGRLQKVRASGDRKWMAACPSHEDRTPSLSIKQLEDGRILIKCHAGCGAADVMASVGLSLADLYQDGAIAHELKGWAQMYTKPENIRDDALLAIADTARQQGQRLTPKEREAELQAFLRTRAKQTTKATA